MPSKVVGFTLTLPLVCGLVGAEVFDSSLTLTLACGLGSTIWVLRLLDNLQFLSSYLLQPAALSMG